MAVGVKLGEWSVRRYLRFVEIVAGSIIVILSGLVLTSPNLSVSSQFFFLSLVLLVMGIVRIIVGTFAKYLSEALRYINLRIGIFELLLAIAALLLVEFATQVLVYLLAFSLVIHGITRTIMGGFAEVYPRWLRVLLAMVGLSTIVLSLAIFVSARVGFQMPSTAILSVAAMLNGIARVFLGIAEMRSEEVEKAEESAWIFNLLCAGRHACRESFPGPLALFKKRFFITLLASLVCAWKWKAFVRRSDSKGHGHRWHGQPMV